MRKPSHRADHSALFSNLFAGFTPPSLKSTGESENTRTLTDKLAHNTQPDGTTVKTLELSRELFEEDEHSVEVFARAVAALNDEEGLILDEDITTFLYLVQVHNTYKFFDSMAIKLRKEVIFILFSWLKCFVANMCLPVAWLPPDQAFLGIA